jgi:hypothetical protein
MLLKWMSAFIFLRRFGEDTVATTASARRLLNVNEFRGLFLGQQHLVI